MSRLDSFPLPPLFLAWLVSVTAALGTLFFSEVMGYPPCVLCWYQRIAMYPLALLLAVGIWDRDARVVRYAFPFVIVGLCIALFHLLLYHGVIPERISPCTADAVSCTTTQIAWLGFISIPLLSFAAFTIIGGLLFIFRKQTLRGAQ